MEVVGVVLGAVPLAIKILQCYKVGRNVTDRLRNRKRHIRRLILALQGYDAAIELYLVWLLKAVGSYEAHHTPSDLPALMRDIETVTRLEEYLGVKVSQAFRDALLECQESILVIGRSIEGFLPAKQDDDHTLATILRKQSEDVKFEFRKGIKLALRKDDVEEQIEKLDAATKIIGRLHNARTAIHQIEITSSTKDSKKLLDSLGKVQRYANQLYEAINFGWIPGCHSAHEAMLLLEDRTRTGASPKHCLGNKMTPVTFTVIFSSGTTADSTSFFDEIPVEVIEDDANGKQGCTILTTSEAPRITVSTPATQSRALPIIDVDNICLLINKAKLEDKMLRLYLLKEAKLLHGHSPRSSPMAGLSTISLESLINASSTTNDRSKKLPLKTRLVLALTLASSLLQLKTTPWLANHWTKRRIHFLIPKQSSQVQARPCITPPATSQADLSRPLIIQTFENVHTPFAPYKPPSPREIILELGVMLLELWSETTLESYCTMSGITLTDCSDYHTRVSIAHRWLEEAEEHFPPAYFDATARCLKCHFGGMNVNPQWDNVELAKGIVEGVVGPLNGLCRPQQ